MNVKPIRMSKKKKKSDKDALDESLAVPTLQIGDEIPEMTVDSTMGLFNLHDLIDGSFAVGRGCGRMNPTSWNTS